MEIKSWRKAIGNELIILDVDSKIFNLILLDSSLLDRVNQYTIVRRASIALVSKSINQSSQVTKYAYSRLQSLLQESNSFHSGFFAIDDREVIHAFKDEKLLKFLPFLIKRFLWGSWFKNDSAGTISAAKLAITSWFDSHGINYFDDYGSSIVTCKDIIALSSFLKQCHGLLDIYLVTDSMDSHPEFCIMSYSEFFDRIGARSHVY